MPFFWMDYFCYRVPVKFEEAHPLMGHRRSDQWGTAVVKRFVNRSLIGKSWSHDQNATIKTSMTSVGEFAWRCQTTDVFTTVYRHVSSSFGTFQPK